MTTQTYEPHWEAYVFSGKQHLIVRGPRVYWTTACGLYCWYGDFVAGNYERGVDRCRSCDRSAT